MPTHRTLGNLIEGNLTHSAVRVVKPAEIGLPKSLEVFRYRFSRLQSSAGVSGLERIYQKGKFSDYTLGKPLHLNIRRYPID